MPLYRPSTAPWMGRVHALWGDGNPSIHDSMWSFQNTVASVAGPTPTGIGTAVGRLVSFRYEKELTVANVRWFGVAAVATTYTAAVYSGTTRLWTATISTAAAAWSSVAASFVIPAGTQCWFGLGTTATGTTAGFRSPASPIASSLGLATMPGNLDAYGPKYSQVALTAGAWPTTLPALAAAAFASAGSTGTVPIFYADAA